MRQKLKQIFELFVNTPDPSRSAQFASNAIAAAADLTDISGGETIAQ